MTQETFEGDHILVTFSTSQDGTSIQDIEVLEATLNSQGVSGVSAEFTRFLSGIDLEKKLVVQNKDHRIFNLLAILGFRGGYLEAELVYAPEQPLPTLCVEQITPGCFDGDCMMEMRDDVQMRIRDVDIADETASGAIITEILEINVRKMVTDGTGLFGEMNAVQERDGSWVRLKDHPDFHEIAYPDGKSVFVIATSDNRLIVNGHTFTDLWEAPEIKQARSEFSKDIIASLNGDLNG